MLKVLELCVIIRSRAITCHLLPKQQKEQIIQGTKRKNKNKK